MNTPDKGEVVEGVLGLVRLYGDRVHSGKFVDRLKAWDELQLEAKKLADQLVVGEVLVGGKKLRPVGWQFYSEGKWHMGSDQIRDHKKNTEEAGYPIRSVYAVVV